MLNTEDQPRTPSQDPPELEGNTAQHLHHGHSSFAGQISVGKSLPRPKACDPRLLDRAVSHILGASIRETAWTRRILILTLTPANIEYHDVETLLKGSFSSQHCRLRCPHAYYMPFVLDSKAMDSFYARWNTAKAYPLYRRDVPHRRMAYKSCGL